MTVRRAAAGLAAACALGFAGTWAYLIHEINRALAQIGRTT